MSRLDYCNGLLHGLPTHLVAKLQSILNTATRLVTKPRKYEHITPVMINLHWLPIQYRIQFKLLLLMYKSLHGLAQSNLADKLSLRPNKGLPSYNQLLLNVPVSILRLKFYGDQAFSVARPTLWNALPKNIRLCATLATFKTSLKSYLLESLQGMTVCPIDTFYFRFVSTIYIDFLPLSLHCISSVMIHFTSDLFLRFTFIFNLYHFIVSALSVTSHN